MEYPEGPLDGVTWIGLHVEPTARGRTLPEWTQVPDVACWLQGIWGSSIISVLWGAHSPSLLLQDCMMKSSRSGAEHFSHRKVPHQP